MNGGCAAEKIPPKLSEVGFYLDTVITMTAYVEDKQVLMACLVMNNTRLLISYLPALIGIGAAVGCLTGIVTDRVLKVLKLKPNV